VRDESLMKFELRDGVISIGANLTRRDLFTALAMHELFAALAMQGLCANDSTRGADVARLAVEIADTLLVELAKERR
jgi:hypothetical protein